MLSVLNKVKIVLVGTSHPGNIGSVARAMKVMGLSNLVLVEPQCEVDEQTIALASGAADIVQDVQIVSSLEEAVADCGLVIGTSTRSRTLDWPMLEPRQCGEKVVQEAEIHPVALLFGRERTGLTNDELQLCHYHASIPANPEYSSLNLAMAVQVFSYEIRIVYLEKRKNNYSRTEKNHNQQEYPRHNELELFYQHLEKVITDTQFLSHHKPNMVMNKLRRLFSRARPEFQEINILRGILTSIERQNQNKDLP